MIDDAFCGCTSSENCCPHSIVDKFEFYIEDLEMVWNRNFVLTIICFHSPVICWDWVEWVCCIQCVHVMPQTSSNINGLVVVCLHCLYYDCIMIVVRNNAAGRLLIKLCGNLVVLNYKSFLRRRQVTSCCSKANYPLILIWHPCLKQVGRERKHWLGKYFIFCLLTIFYCCIAGAYHCVRIDCAKSLHSFITFLNLRM